MNSDSASADSFRHSSLALDEIRLLKVDLDDPSLELSLSVLHFRKSELPGYQAISYTWGEQPHKYKTIHLNGHPFEITQNAFWCLHFICKHYRRWQYLWIDSVCIDQRNIAERNEQVQLMDQVYCDATLVLAWLGSDRQIDGDAWSAKAGQRKCSSTKQILYDLPYWRRLWIVKEVYFARQILYLCGPVETTLVDFWKNTIATLDIINALIWDMDLDDGPHGVMTMYALMSERHQLGVSIEFPRWPKELTLLTSFFWFKCHDCADPRDRVFSIMGLLPGPEQRALARYFPDYSINMEKFWLIVFAHLLLWHGLCEDMLYQGTLGINIGGKPREALAPTSKVLAALMPMLRQDKHHAQSRPARSYWRRSRKGSQQSDLSARERRESEFRIQEELMHKVIAEFDR